MSELIAAEIPEETPEETPAEPIANHDTKPRDPITTAIMGFLNAAMRTPRAPKEPPAKKFQKNISTDQLIDDVKGSIAKMSVSMNKDSETANAHLGNALRETDDVADEILMAENEKLKADYNKLYAEYAELKADYERLKSNHSMLDDIVEHVRDDTTKILTKLFSEKSKIERDLVKANDDNKKAKATIRKLQSKMDKEKRSLPELLFEHITTTPTEDDKICSPERCAEIFEGLGLELPTE